MIVLIAQRRDLQQNQSGFKEPSEYYFSKNKSDSVKINIWGEVKRPGVYHLSTEVNLLTLLSMAGGPTQNANLSNLKIINSRTDTVKTVDITPLLEKGKDISIPQIQNGSTVIISQKTSSKIYHYLSWVSRILGIFSIYFMIRYYYISG